MLTTTDSGTLSASTMARLEDLSEWATELEGYVRSPRTIRAYRSDWRQLQTWADSFDGLIDIPDPEDLTEPIPVRIIEGYVTDRARPGREYTVAPQTITRHLSAIKWWHHQAGLVSPTDHPALVDRLAAIRRRVGVQVRKADPIFLDDLRAMMTVADDSPKGLRDRALLVVGWRAALRRSELVALDVGDVTQDPAGLVVTLRRSKSDQEGRGMEKLLTYRDDQAVCPVVNLRRWMRLVDDAGPLLRATDRWGNVTSRRITGRTVAQTVKRYAAAIGLDPDRVSGHSLRAGYVSYWRRRGATTSAIRMVTGHQSTAMVDNYDRAATLAESIPEASFDD